MKPLVFMSGQLCDLPLAVKQDWGYTRSSRRAETKDEGFTLDSANFVWKGAIYYASDPNTENASRNLEILTKVPCWPDPSKLIRMVDRHTVAQECFAKGFYGSDPCEILTYDMCIDLNPVAVVDTVVKTGNEHSGEGKTLVRKGVPFPKWDGFATLQPFFEGRSIRILHLDSAIFFIETVNASSWIKNSPGGENVLFDAKQIPSEMLDHSSKVRDHFGLDICGNDYILTDGGSFHFLETNQFPGLGDDFLGDLPRDFFLERMRSLEKVVIRNTDVQRPEVLPAR